ncbi:S-layer homology domain-containing protein [Paenibacillus contaminans]|uniref:SLH domain-containing protein n=1 Tax=Paenibacillus contaminans TaxID=450362 RepID=A0A329MK81_9BACL|nr:S-layer homology domain-containing protein [Paenibacillus contaminans]RAV20060.1 hypothetical protein DQG23_16430 [Paenibacillus contaminans]
MNRKITLFTFIVFFLSCLPIPLLATAYAETAPSFLLTADKPVDGKITLTMSGKNIDDLYGYEAKLTFDPDRLELAKAESELDGFSVQPIVKNNEITLAHTKTGNKAGESGDFIIGTLTFKMKKDGASSVKWISMKAVNRNLAVHTYSVEESVSVASPKKGFIDLDGHWAKADIELLASKGIVEGMDEHHFVPQGQVTRAQFAALISRALKLKTNAEEIPFADVAPDSWYKDVVTSAYSAGIIQGMTETRFAPEKDITREEMAVMIVRAINHVRGSASEDTTGAAMTFADSESISEWAKEGIHLSVRLGIINGRTEDRFVPQDRATRAEAATVMKRLLSALNLL